MLEVYDTRYTEKKTMVQYSVTNKRRSHCFPSLAHFHISYYTIYVNCTESSAAQIANIKKESVLKDGILLPIFPNLTNQKKRCI